MVENEESLPKSGVLTSPNYPEHYPNNHDSTQTVQVAEGKTIRYVWTNYQTEGGPYDYVEIVDGDGTILMPRPTGIGSLNSLWDQEQFMPGSSNSNIMHVKFHTDGEQTRTGWRLEWSEE